MSDFQYKIANTDDEFEAIHSLNYQTFVNEIPQHSPNNSKRLVDKFHDENTYFICLKQGELVAMVAGRTNRPFSLDHKITDLDKQLPKNSAPVEVRLLSVVPEYRKTKVCAELIEKLCTYYASKGQDLGLISATTREARLYSRLGFEKFGSLVGSNDAQYQPMYLTTDNYKPVAKKLDNIVAQIDTSINLQPGPVSISEAVKSALSAPAISHRGEAFSELLNKVTTKLCDLTSLSNCYLFQGSGTLANEFISAQLSVLKTPGIILVNGEFGQRLVNQATRWKLDFTTIDFGWGNNIDLESIQNQLSQNSDIGWIWFTGLETSVGINNPYQEILHLSKSFGVKCCVDAVSLIGSDNTDFSEAFLVSGTSGKGLCSYSGLAFVGLGQGKVCDKGALPSYLDLSLYEQKSGIPFTISSNLVNALDVALNRCWQQRFETITSASQYLFESLTALGISLINKDTSTLSSTITIEVPSFLSSRDIANRIKAKGYLLYAEPSYLVERNWLQICLYSIESIVDVYRLPELIKAELAG